MANKKISDLTALGGNFSANDIFEVSKWTGSAYLSRYITGAEMSASIGASNIGNSDLTIDSAGDRKLIMNGALATDRFVVRNSADTGDLFIVQGNGVVYSHGALNDNNTIYGKDAANTSSTSINCVLYGREAGSSLTNGYQNVFIGRQAGNSTTSGYKNIYIGHQAASSGTSANRNTVIGDVQNINATANRNVIIGSGITAPASNFNVILGDNGGNHAITKDTNHNVYFSDNTALATTATNGFVYVRGGAGVPTGTPAATITGHVPMYADTTNNKLYIYSGGSWVALN